MPYRAYSYTIWFFLLNRDNGFIFDGKEKSRQTKAEDEKLYNFAYFVKIGLPRQILKDNTFGPNVSAIKISKDNNLFKEFEEPVGVNRNMMEIN